MEQITNALRRTCQTLFSDAMPEGVVIALTRPEEKFGDYATNVAMQLAGRLGRPPRDVAQAIVDDLQQNARDIIEKAEVAGPGFINIWLKDEVLAGLIDASPKMQGMAGKTVLVEYSDPNAMKPLHAGHLYTTLVGDVIARLVERSGANVVRLNYGGDVGLHVAKSMWAIVKDLGGELPEKLESIAEADRPSWLGSCYATGHAAYEDDETAHAEIVECNKRVYQVHSDSDHDSAFARIYWTCREWSYKYFKQLYAELQVAPFDRFIPESEVTPLGLKTVREQQAAGVFQESDGAIVFKGEDFGLHTRVFINANGLPTYETKDVGLLLTKWQDYSFDTSIVITANEQAQYFQVMLKSVEQFMPDPAQRSVHITHGLLKLQGGVKMSSRKGNVVTALEILDAARTAASETGNNASEETVLAAIKYALTKNKIGGDIAYDPKESIALEGNSGPYLQYAHARACSIIGDRKAPEQISGPFGPGERTLVRKLGEYHEVLDLAVGELMPHHICTYLYELSQTFNRFYEGNRVIGDEREAVRLSLVASYIAVLRDGLGLLGIAAPERM